MNITEIRKFIIALVGVVGIAVAQGVLPESSNKYAVVAVALVAALGVFVVPNGSPTP